MAYRERHNKWPAQSRTQKALLHCSSSVMDAPEIQASKHRDGAVACRRVARTSACASLDVLRLIWSVVASHRFPGLGGLTQTTGMQSVRPLEKRGLEGQGKS
jgi:hypothetical protein